MLRRWTAALAGCLLAVAGALGAAGQTFTPARDELLAARSITMDVAEAWAAELLALNPAVASYEITEPGHLVVTRAGGGEVDIYLDALVNRLSVRGAPRGRVLAEYEAEVYDSLARARRPPRPSPENVVPIVRHRDVLAAATAAAGELGGAGPIHSALAGDLVVLLAYEGPSSVALMSRRALGLDALSDDEAIALAVDNLARRAEELSWAEAGGLRLAAMPGDLEGSLLLLDDVWDDLEAELGGAVAVAVPLSGQLVAARADRPEDVAALRTLIAAAELNPYAVSEEVLVRDGGGGWKVLVAEE